MKAAIVGIAGPRLSAAEHDLIRAAPPAGIILFGRNIETPAQLAQLIADLRSILPADAVLMLDQEGGRVARLRPPHWAALPPANSFGALWQQDRYLARQAARAHGAALGAMAREAGFDVITAPVLDVPVPDADGVIGDRAISDDPVAVAILGGDIAWGILFQGVQPVMKHLPGHGRAMQDSHHALPRVTAARLDTDMAPFIANHDLPWAMTAHIVFDAIDPAHPATLSPRVISELIRGKIGFRGILVTDDLAMNALSGAPAGRARAALAAGCDIALYCPGDIAGNTAVLDAVPMLDPALIPKLKVSST